MSDVWLVTGSVGEWSDYSEWVESAWDSEAGAVAHVVRDIGATPDADAGWRGRSWTLGAVGDWDPIVYTVDRIEVCHRE